MDRRAFLAGAIGAGLTCFTRSLSGLDRPPNILVVLCDDLGFGDVSCHGHPVIRTPHFDAFASEGMRFTDCYAASAVCSPSRAGLLTGRTPDRTGVFDWLPMQPTPIHLRREEITWARLLREAGYRTCLSGKWHLNGVLGPDNPQPQPFEHGFDHWFATGAWATPSQRNPDNFVRNGRPCGPIEGYSSAIIVDEALRWLDATRSDKPFGLMVSFHAPHEPVASAPRYVSQYSGRPHRPGEDEYYANVTELDAEFGRLLAFLDTRGLRDDTLVVFTSDNGPEVLNRHQDAGRSYGSAGPLRGMKLSLYEGGCRVPGAVRWAGRIRPKQVNGTPVSSVDLLPTICESVGIERPARTLDGASLVPLFDGRPIRREVPLHWHYGNASDRAVASVRDGDWKLLGVPRVRAAKGNGQPVTRENLPQLLATDFSDFELYDLAHDPAERRDLAPVEKRRVQELADRLIRLDTSVHAESPRWELPPAGADALLSPAQVRAWQHE
jgi:arylsulfatase A